MQNPYITLLEDRMTALDKFIEQKLKAAGHGLKENSIDVMINPDNDFKIKDGQGAILIV